MKNYFIIKENHCDHPYLVWKEDDKWMADSCFSPVDIVNELKRKILKIQKIILPTRKQLNDWRTWEDILPTCWNIYVPSETVLTLQCDKNIIHESHWYPINMEWIDAESSAPYSEFKPTHWKPYPRIENMEDFHGQY